MQWGMPGLLEAWMPSDTQRASLCLDHTACYSMMYCCRCWNAGLGVLDQCLLCESSVYREQCTCLRLLQPAPACASLSNVTITSEAWETYLVFLVIVTVEK